MSRISAAQFACFLCVAALAVSGCKTADMRCQRETALLRAEILDIEDKYYSLLAQQRGSARSRIVSSSQVPVVDPRYPHGVIIDDGYVDGDIIYDDAVISGPVYGGPVFGGQVYDSYGGGPIYSDVPPAQGSAAAQPTMALREPAPNRSINDAESDLDSAVEPESGFETEGVPFDDVDIDLEGSLPARDDGASMDLLELPTMLDVGYSRNVFSEAEIRGVTILNQHSHGEDVDGQPGDDGLALMIQALDVDGRPVPPVGTATVTVNDLSRNYQIGKWTFLSSELELFESTDGQGRPATLLHLPWSDDVPRANEVRVTVKLTDESGEEIVDSLVLPVVPKAAGQTADPSLVAGWTQSDDRWYEKSSRGFGQSTEDEQRQPLRRLKAIPASSRKTIEMPKWRPVR